MDNNTEYTPQNKVVFHYKGGKLDPSLNVTHVIVDKRLKTIPNSAFNRCTSLQVVKFECSEKITSVGHGAFFQCVKLESIILPKVVSVGSLAFYQCFALYEIHLPSLHVIEECAFSFCKSLKTIHFPSSLQRISFTAFGGCESLESVQLPPSLQTLGHECFCGCKSLKIAYVPTRALVFSARPFMECNLVMILTEDDVDEIAEQELEKIGRDKMKYSSLQPVLSLKDVNSLIQCLLEEQIPTTYNENNQLHQINDDTSKTTDDLHGEDEYEEIDLKLLSIEELHQACHHHFSEATTRADMSEFSLGHLLIHFPYNNVTAQNLLAELVEICPDLITKQDASQLTPLDHILIEYNHRHYFCDSVAHNNEMGTILLEHYPPDFIHQAIETGFSWNIISFLMSAKREALILPSKKSGFFPFMILAEREYMEEMKARECAPGTLQTEDGRSSMFANTERHAQSLENLSAIYELLRSRPDVLIMT